jgi:hypothetical protein
MSLPRHPIPGPDGQGPGTMGDALEASPQRLLDHLRRPVPGRRDLLTNDAGHTVSEIVPEPAETVDDLSLLSTDAVRERVPGRWCFAVAAFRVAVGIVATAAGQSVCGATGAAVASDDRLRCSAVAADVRGNCGPVRLLASTWPRPTAAPAGVRGPIAGQCGSATANARSMGVMHRVSASSAS